MKADGTGEKPEIGKTFLAISQPGAHDLRTYMNLLSSSEKLGHGGTPMHHQASTKLPTHHLFLTFGLAGPPTGFAIAVLGATAALHTPEGIEALIYGLHPLGLALIYAAGLAPALATAGILLLLQDRSARLSIILAGITGFLVTLAYGTIATLATPVPNPITLAVVLAGVGMIAAAICIILARQVPKILAATPEAR